MKAIYIACNLVKQAETIDKELTNLDLQKLVYFAHGWHLAIKEEPLIEEEIQAWKYGPVIPDLYHQLKAFGSEPVPFAKIKKKCDDSEDMTPDIETFLKAIWQVYKRYDTFQLVRATHAGDTPWDKITREFRGMASNIIISNQEIKKFFKTKLSNDRKG